MRATPQELKRAYHELSKENHPDKCSAEDEQMCQSKFIKVRITLCPLLRKPRRNIWPICSFLGNLTPTNVPKTKKCAKANLSRRRAPPFSPTPNVLDKALPIRSFPRITTPINCCKDDDQIHPSKCIKAHNTPAPRKQRPNVSPMCSFLWNITLTNAPEKLNKYTQANASRHITPPPHGDTGQMFRSCVALYGASH